MDFNQASTRPPKPPPLANKRSVAEQAGLNRENIEPGHIAGWVVAVEDDEVHGVLMHGPQSADYETRVQSRFGIFHRVTHHPDESIKLLPRLEQARR